MATATKLIDINRSYVPVDPKTFPENLFYNSAEDSPEGRVPVVPYDGYNFMPTGNGYMSYFGINSELGVDALTELASPFTPLNVDDLFIVQTPDLRNIGVALTEDGIWTKHLSTPGAWEKVITLTVPDAGVHKNWTRCVIGNEVFMFRAGEASFWTMRDAENFVPTAQVPNTLNMAAQQGIFKAGGRLGFWDSDSSVAWSDVDVKTDFAPSLETGAGAAKFQNVKGKIANILSHGNGFVIYATKSITHIRRGSDANFFWDAETVFDDNGISYKDNVTQGQPDTTHFAYTTFGIVKIENGRSEYLIPEVFSWLKEKREPVYPKLLEGRYLFLQFISFDFVLGTVTFSHEVVPGTNITFKGASYYIEHITENPCKALNSANSQHEGIYLFNTFGYTNKTQATTAGQVPIWEDVLGSGVSVEEIKVFKAFYEAGMPLAYFDSAGAVPFDEGGIAKIDESGDEFFLPTAARSLQEASTYEQVEHIEDNTQDFYNKQELLWTWEEKFSDAFIEAIKQKLHEPIEKDTVFPSGAIPPTTSTKHTFGPFVEHTFLSEANRIYGLNTKSAWLQRSLTREVRIVVTETIEYIPVAPVMLSTISEFDPPLPENLTVADLALRPITETPGTVYSAATTDFFDDFTIAGSPYFYGGGGECYPTGSVLNINQTNGVISVLYSSAHPYSFPLPGGGSGQSCISFTMSTGGVPGKSDAEIQALYNGISVPLVEGDEFPDTYGKIRQSFSVSVEKTTVDTCVYKELGHTRIKGHGHYTLLGAFIEDDENAEAADYEDICDTDPEKTRNVFFNGVQIPSSLPTGCLPGESVIDTETFTYPDQVITLPPSSFLMQDGSIEPIYPTFQGAFVYDLHYKKWGKCGQPFKQLLNWSPINSVAGDKPVPADIFNVNAGCLLEDGTIKIFDKYPSDSQIKIGKIGYYRKGFTDCEIVEMQHRDPATGSIIIEGSIDGKNIEPAISQIYTYENLNMVRAPFTTSAKWFDMTITGIYDIRNIDFNGHRKGKR